MKSPLIIAILFSFLTACAHQSPTYMMLGGPFKITLPSDFVAGGTIFSTAEETAIKSASGAFIAGGMITANNQNLPQGFDITKFPEYLLGLRSVEDLDPDTAMLFRNSSSSYDYTYGLDGLVVMEDENMKLYLLCKAENCAAYVVKNGLDELILWMHSMNVDRNTFMQTAKGSLNAKRQ